MSEGYGALPGVHSRHSLLGRNSLFYGAKAYKSKSSAALRHWEGMKESGNKSSVNSVSNR